MNAILAIPFELRLLVLFVLGACAGELINLAVSLLLIERETFHPWRGLVAALARSKPGAKPDGASQRQDERRPASAKKQGKQKTTAARIAPRGWLDGVPIIGWFRLRREEPLHGTGFWVRPLVVDVMTAIVFAWLYWWEVGQMQAIPFFRVLVPPALVDQANLHWRYAASVLLICLMIAASVLDLREYTIPDGVTVPGLLLGLALAGLVPGSLPAVVTFQPPPNILPPPGPADFLTLNSPNPWPAALAAQRPWPLALGLGCLWLWCLGLLDRTWRGRRGVRFAIGLMATRIVRSCWTYQVLAMGLLASLGVTLSWWFGGSGWRGLLSALVGVAAGGGLVWVVRCIGFVALRREALGFGDVTLMAMIGAFLGWQSCVLIFFIGPVFGILPGLAKLIARRRFGVPLPYGPFLCLGALTAMALWAPIWEGIEPVFGIGWLVPAVLGICAR